MKAPSFARVAPEYARLWTRMTIRPDKAGSVDAIVHRLIARKGRYPAVEKAARVPWSVSAAVQGREAGGRFDRHLHTGVPLSGYPRQVPAGRPRVGHGPPFGWEESAIDAIRYDGLDRVADWSVERACYELEKYNGWGTRARGVPTPYLWSYSNNYSRGKYVADHVWSDGAVSQQCGAMPILRRMMASDGTVKFAPTKQPDVPVPKPAPSPARHASVWATVTAAVAGTLGWLDAHPLVVIAAAALVVALAWHLR